MARWADKPAITAEQAANSDKIPFHDSSQPVGSRDRTLTVHEAFKLFRGASYVGPLAPTVHNDANDGYGVGAQWLDTSTGALYVLVNASVGAAVWEWVNPSAIDRLEEFPTFGDFPGTGEPGVVYVALDTEVAYRWSGSLYVAVMPALTLGESAGTAYRGDRGKVAFDHSQVTTGNPHGVTAAQVGARPVDWVPEWGDVSGKPSSFPPSSHTHSMSDITGLSTALGKKVETSLVGEPAGIAELDSSGHVPASQLPSFVDDVLEFADLASFPTPGEAGKIYVAKDSNIIYRWSGTGYTEISSTIALGVTSSTAYRGDRGKIAYDHVARSDNPHGVTAAQVGARPVDWVPEWGDVSGKPSTFPPSSHTHDAGDIDSGTLSTDRIPDLDADKITSGTLSKSRLPTPDTGAYSTGTLTAATGASLLIPFTANRHYYMEIRSLHQGATKPGFTVIQFASGATTNDTPTFAQAEAISGSWRGNITVFTRSNEIGVHLERPEGSYYGQLIGTVYDLSLGVGSGGSIPVTSLTSISGAVPSGVIKSVAITDWRS